MPSSARGDVAIVVGGQAGQGIQTIEFILTRVLKRSGFHVFATKEYMSRIRGGSNSTLIRVGDRRVPANVDRIDVLVPLDDGALDNLAHRISPGTLILGEKDRLREGSGCVDAPFTAMAESVGGKIYANTVAIATLCGILRTDFEVLRSYLADHFRRKGDQVVARNVEAARKGYDLGEGLRSSGGFRFSVERHAEMSGDLLVSGAQAVALGAVSGGCRFVASYPMSPSTAVLTYMARNDRR
ncbi:MAG: 2-oxoacid:acceptor oxidoreductase family protein, partial [bacterium]